MKKALIDGNYHGCKMYESTNVSSVHAKITLTGAVNISSDGVRRQRYAPPYLWSEGGVWREGGVEG